MVKLPTLLENMKIYEKVVLVMEFEIATEIYFDGTCHIHQKTLKRNHQSSASKQLRQI
jgi:hypothetical protein